MAVWRLTLKSRNDTFSSLDCRFLHSHRSSDTMKFMIQAFLGENQLLAEVFGAKRLGGETYRKHCIWCAHHHHVATRE